MHLQSDWKEIFLGAPVAGSLQTVLLFVSCSSRHLDSRFVGRGRSRLSASDTRSGISNQIESGLWASLLVLVLLSLLQQNKISAAVLILWDPSTVRRSCLLPFVPMRRLFLLLVLLMIGCCRLQATSKLRRPGARPAERWIFTLNGLRRHQIGTSRRPSRL